MRITLFVIFLFISLISSSQTYLHNREKFDFSKPNTCKVGAIKDLGILFEFAKCNFYPEFEDSVKQVVDFMKAYPYIQVEIVRYEKVNPEASVRYGQCRAQNIKEVMVRHGIDSKRIKTAAFSDTDFPIVPNAVIDAEKDLAKKEEYKYAINRRTEVKIVALYPDDRLRFSYIDKKTFIPGAVRNIGILFEFGKSTFYPEFSDSLLAFAGFLKQYPHIKVEVGVHTDTRVSDQSSTKLSANRAHKIGKFLKQNGVDERQFICNGYEKTMPIVPVSVIDAEPLEDLKEKYHAINRRVEIKIISVN